MADIVEERSPIHHVSLETAIARVLRKTTLLPHEEADITVRIDGSTRTVKAWLGRRPEGY